MIGSLHVTIVIVVLQAEAQELEMVKLSKFGAGLGAPSREERLRDAAAIHLKLGNLQRYCELLVELGEVGTCTCVHYLVGSGSVHTGTLFSSSSLWPLNVLQTL